MLGPERSALKKKQLQEEGKTFLEDLKTRSKEGSNDMEIYKSSIGDLMCTPGALIELKKQKDGAQTLQKKRKNVINLGHLQRGQTFGDRDIIMERPRKTKVKCLTLTGLLLRATAKDFMILKNDAENWKNVEKQADLQKDIFKERKNIA